MSALPDKETFLESLLPSIAADGDCPICYEDYKSAITTPCHHDLCAECIKTWLESSNTCPSCRTELYEKLLGEEDDFDDSEDDGLSGDEHGDESYNSEVDELSDDEEDSSDDVHLAIMQDEEEDENGETAFERNKVEHFGFPTYEYPQIACDRLLEIFRRHIETSQQPDEASVLKIDQEGNPGLTCELGIRGFIRRNDNGGEFVVNERQVRFMLRHRLPIDVEMEWDAVIQ